MRQASTTPRAASVRATTDLEDLGLDEEIAESRMPGVSGSGSEHHFQIAGQFNVARAIGIIRDTYAPQLGVVFRRDDDLHAGNNSCIAAAELCFVFGQSNLVGLRLPADWQMAG